MANLDISDFIRPNGRLDYLRLKEHAHKVSPGEFALLFRRPLLVGSAVCSGKLQDAANVNQTMLFKIKDLANEDDEANTLQTAIFALYKQSRGDSKPNIIKIGRANENDIVLNDYPVSREHAFIRLEGSRYFVTDCHTTNGTTINEHPLRPEVESEIKAGDILGFARYRFYFMKPEALHKRLTVKLA